MVVTPYGTNCNVVKIQKMKHYKLSFSCGSPLTPALHRGSCPTLLCKPTPDLTIVAAGSRSAGARAPSRLAKSGKRIRPKSERPNGLEGSIPSAATDSCSAVVLHESGDTVATGRCRHRYGKHVLHWSASQRCSYSRCLGRPIAPDRPGTCQVFMKRSGYPRGLLRKM